MALPRPTHDVFKSNPSKPSYEKFVPAKSVVVEPHIEQPVEEHDAPNDDRLEQLRREDDAYLESLAQSQRCDALELLEREIQERDLFRRQRGTVKRRVNVADSVRGRVEEPSFGGLGLGSVIRKKRAGNKSDAKVGEKTGDLVDGKTRERRGTSDDTADGMGREAQPVELVTGYESSSDDEEQQVVKNQDAACERTEERSDRD